MLIDGFTRLVLTRPTSPVDSFLPVNQLKQDTRCPTMTMCSPGATLSSSGPSASYSSVTRQIPLAEQEMEEEDDIQYDDIYGLNIN